MNFVPRACFSSEAADGMIKSRLVSLLICGLPWSSIIVQGAKSEQLDSRTNPYPKSGSSRFIFDGISFQILPSSVRPVLLLFVPPHCLKKNGTSNSWQASLISRTHSFIIGLAPGLRFTTDNAPVLIRDCHSRTRSASSGTVVKKCVEVNRNQY